MGKIEGVVRKKSDNSLVEGAIVTFTGYDSSTDEVFIVGRQTTNAQGEFEFNNVNTGEDYEYEGSAHWEDAGTLFNAESIPFVTVEDAFSGFATEWQTTEANEAIELPLVDGGTYDFTVDWGDGSQDTINAWDDSAKNHEYAEAGTYDVEITGQCWGWQFDSNSFAPKILDVKHWGEDFRLGALGNFPKHFRGCTNLNVTANDVMPTTGLTTMGDSFMNTDLTTFNRVNDIDMSNITRLGGTISGLFMNSNFNHDVHNWNVSSVTAFGGVFRNTPFNSSVEGWTFNASGTSLERLFEGSAFNNSSPLNWDVSNVTSLERLFFGTPFNQDLSNWNVSNVTNMAGMFQESDFNNNSINNWDVSNVITMARMFRGFSSTDLSVFDQDISGWITTSLQDMREMFMQSQFNQDIGGWDVSNVTDMFGLFRFINSFDQDLSSWDISNVTDMDEFTGEQFSTANYDAMLIAWEQLTLQNNVVANFGDSEYSSGAAATARQSIINTYTWTINDGGEAT